MFVNTVADDADLATVDDAVTVEELSTDVSNEGFLVAALDVVLEAVEDAAESNE